jgi:hypothetical protein
LEERALKCVGALRRRHMTVYAGADSGPAETWRTRRRMIAAISVSSLYL